jgi:hypothetical protein
MLNEASVPAQISLTDLVAELGREFIEPRWRRLFRRPLQPPYSTRWIAAWGPLVFGAVDGCN